MTNKINYVDICCGLSWGDEAKGKIVSYLAKTGNYNFVCRWAGGNNAGHTIYKNGIKYKTHLIPSGIFYNICSVIGPDCVINKESFFEEVNYLKKNGFNTDLILISPNAHVITDIHIKEDIDKLHNSQGTTGKGIAPCYKDKYARKGILAKSVKEFEQYLWDEKLYGNILCEGAQGYWLDIIKGNYPYVTSSNTLPYSACSLGFPPQYIRKIYGASKIYDTRSGVDPFFSNELLNNKDLLKLIEVGKEYGTTTGRMRTTNWLNLDKLIEAINISGTTIIIISKIDVIEKINIYKLFYNFNIINFDNFSQMKEFINDKLKEHCNLLDEIIYSDNVELTNLE